LIKSITGLKETHHSEVVCSLCLKSDLEAFKILSIPIHGSVFRDATYVYYFSNSRANHILLNKSRINVTWLAQEVSKEQWGVTSQDNNNGKTLRLFNPVTVDLDTRVKSSIII